MKVKNKKERKTDEFRKNKVTGHPAYIYAKQGHYFKYLGITHSKKTNDRNNLKLYKNPNPKDNREAFVITRPSKDYVNNFKKKEKNWSLSKKDKNQIKKLIK